MGAELLTGAEADGLRFMLHVFFCRECPRTLHAGTIAWTLQGFAIEDHRDADGALSGGHALCLEGWKLARAARARGWGA